MFKAKIKAGILKEMLEITQSMVDETKIEISENGIHSQMVDPAHVQMQVLDIDSMAFEEFEIDSFDYTIGIDIDKILNILRSSMVKNDEIISLELKDDFREEDKHYLYIKIGRIEQKMKLLETAGMSDTKSPTLNLPAKVIIAKNEILTKIKRAIGMVGSITDKIRFSIKKEEFEISAKGDRSSINLKIPKEVFEVFEPEKVDEDIIKVSSLYSLDLVREIWKLIKCTPVTLKLGSDYPYILEYSFADGWGKVKVYQAPRIEVD